jgi:hypothetical protein
MNPKQTIVVEMLRRMCRNGVYLRRVKDTLTEQRMKLRAWSMHTRNPYGPCDLFIGHIYQDELEADYVSK